MLALMALQLPAVAGAASVDKRVDKLEAQLKEMVEAGRHNAQRMAEALASFDAIKEEMAATRGEIDKIRHAVGIDIRKRTSELQRMEHQINRMEERLEGMQIRVRDMAEVSGSTGTKKQNQEKLLYEEAFSELTQKNYKTAYNRFTQYIKKYPKGKLADNAQYWKGECLFALGDYEKSILEFQKVIKHYPKGNKVPAAILKQGYAFQHLKAYADAKAFFELVIAEHPKSREAIRAKEKLAEVNKLIHAGTKK